MNHYIFENASNTAKNAIRIIWLETDIDSGAKSVADILEMNFDGSKDSLKKIVRCLYEMTFVGERDEDKEDYEVRVAGYDYDSSLEGKARKQSSKEINSVTEQLWLEFQK